MTHVSKRSQRSLWFLSHLHDLVLQLGEKVVDDLVLLDGKRVQVDLLHACDLSSLDKSTQLGDWLPFLLF